MDDSSVVRVMPNSLEAEQSVIGSIPVSYTHLTLPTN